MDPLEEVGVGREALDPALCGRSRQGERGGHLGRAVIEPDDHGHAPEPFEIRRVVIRHDHPVAVHARVDVDGQAADALRRHRRDPALGLGAIEFDAHRGGGVEEHGGRIGGGCALRGGLVVDRLVGHAVTLPMSPIKRS